MRKKKIETIFSHIDNVFHLVLSSILILIFIVLFFIVKTLQEKLIVLPFLTLSLSFLLSYLNVEKKYYNILKIVSLIFILIIIIYIYK